MARKSVDSALKPYIQQLGKVPDQDIADKAGVSRAVTVSFRKKLGIPAYNGHRSRHSIEDNAATVTVAPVIAAPPLSTTPAIAENEARSFRGRHSVLDTHAHLVGTLPDAEVARIAGVTPENVRTYRSRRGIKALWRNKDEVKAEVKAEAEAEVKTEVKAEVKTEVKTKTKVKTAAVAEIVVEAPIVVSPVAPAPADTVLYTVSIEHEGQLQHYGILANNLTDAAEKTLKAMAKRHLNGEVRGIERLAELLSL